MASGTSIETDDSGTSGGYDGPTGLALTALDPDFREDPYPILAELREREPVHWDDQLKRYVLTRHEDVNAILRDLSLWSDPRKANPGTFTSQFLSRTGREDEEPSMLLMDDPGHRRLRELVNRSFTPRAVERWRERVRSVAERLVNDLPDGPFDLVTRFADPLPSVVIAEMMGLDPGCYEDFKNWSNLSVVVGFNPMPTEEQVRDAEHAQQSLHALFLEEIAKRRESPGDDLISEMVLVEEAGDRLTEEEIVGQCDLLLIAGNVTTTDLIGNSVKTLIDFPDQQTKLCADLDRVGDAVDEVLRFDPPVTNSGRIASRDMEFHGVKIAKGETLSVSLAAANHDPRVHPDPDRFDLDRADKSTLAFGGGRHFCMGSHLAKVEAQEALRALYGRLGPLRLADGGSERAGIPSFRGFVRLEVEPAPR